MLPQSVLSDQTVSSHPKDTETQAEQVEEAPRIAMMHDGGPPSQTDSDDVIDLTVTGRRLRSDHAHSPVISFGNYKYRPIRYVAESQPAYLFWANHAWTPRSRLKILHGGLNYIMTLI